MQDKSRSSISSAKLPFTQFSQTLQKPALNRSLSLENLIVPSEVTYMHQPSWMGLIDTQSWSLAGVHPRITFWVVHLSVYWFIQNVANRQDKWALLPSAVGDDHACHDFTNPFFKWHDCCLQTSSRPDVKSQKCEIKEQTSINNMGSTWRNSPQQSEETRNKRIWWEGCIFVKPGGITNAWNQLKAAWEYFRRCWISAELMGHEGLCWMQRPLGQVLNPSEEATHHGTMGNRLEHQKFEPIIAAEQKTEKVKVTDNFLYLSHVLGAIFKSAMRSSDSFMIVIVHVINHFTASFVWQEKVTSCWKT